MFTLSIIDLLALFTLGFSFLFIAQGVALAILRLAPVFPLAGRIVNFAAGRPASNPFFPILKRPVWHLILVSWPAVLWLAMAAMGVGILFKYGFLEQNLWYLLISR